MQTGNILPGNNARPLTAPRTSDLLAAMQKRIQANQAADARRIAQSRIEHLPVDLDQARWNRSIDLTRLGHEV